MCGAMPGFPHKSWCPAVKRPTDAPKKKAPKKKGGKDQ